MPAKSDSKHPKTQALREEGTLNPEPEKVREPILVTGENGASSGVTRKPFSTGNTEPNGDNETPRGYQAAQLLDIHHKTLQKLARRGEIHGSHVGKMWRFRASDLNAWLDRQERAS